MNDTTFYICATVLIELLMIAMTLHVLHYSGFTKQQKTWFVLTFSSIVVCSLAELAVHCGVYSVKFAFPLTVVTVIQFSLSPMLAVFFSGALGLHKTAKKTSYIFLIGAAFEIVSAPFGWVFYFDADGYHRSSLFIVYTISYVIGLIYLIVSMIVVGRRFRHRDFSTILMVGVTLVAAILPMLVRSVHVSYIGIGLCASLCYIYYNDLVQEDIHSDLIENQKRISSMQEHTISGLANLIESRDTETGEHVSRTSRYVKLIAEKARAEGVYADLIDDRFIELLYTLAPMHDVGKIVVPDRILKKPGRLTEEEFELMKKHASEGGAVVRRILKGITDEEYVRFASDIATYHHEKWNGAGYPYGLSGGEIPLCARIMAIADVYDALISERCYKKAMSREDAADVIKREAGTHFDPLLASIFLKYLPDEDKKDVTP